jgi:hypothetical protein
MPRHKDPNKPPALKAVRVTEATLKEIHRKRMGTEPLGNTVGRAIKELPELRKKVKAQELEIESLQNDLSTSKLAFDRLFNVHTENKKMFRQLGINPALIEVPNK